MVVDRGFSPRTAVMRRTVIRKFLRDWRTLNPQPEQVEALKQDYVLNGRRRNYVSNIVQAFNAYWRYLGQDYKVKPLSREKTRMPRYLTEQEVQDILFVIDSGRDQALFKCMAYSGLRVAELCALERQDVDLEKRTLTVQLGKGGKSDQIPLHQGACDAIAAYLRSGARRADSPWLFQAVQGKHFGRRLSTQAIRVLCRRYGKMAGVQKAVSPHMFRHSIASALISNGCPLPIVQRQLRHTRIESTLRYLHINDKAQRDNYERFAPAYSTR